MNTQAQESNLNRFWRECRERDIRKRKRKRSLRSDQFNKQNHDNFVLTINQLKFDAQILSKRFNKLKRSKSSKRRRVIDEISNNDKENELKQSENSRIFFENKEYYSSLHDKYLNSFKNDENNYNLKNKLQQKWKDLKKEYKENKTIKSTYSMSTYSMSNLQKSNEYWDFSVRQLKQKLMEQNVSINQCIEKKDLIEKIKKVKKDKKKSLILYQDNTNIKDESKEEIMKRVDLWINRWSYRRSFRQLINSILGYKSNDESYIKRGNHILIMKLYKKAILLIHPDKHCNEKFEIRYKSAEMFKVLNKYKQRYESRRY